MIAARFIALTLSYLIGSFQTGYFYGKSQGIDIRDHGSGNSGTTNTMRVLGRKAGIITFVGDSLKAILAAAVVYFIFRNRYPETVKLLELFAGFGVVLGHNYPFYMGFRGGKGIACTVGVAFAVVLPAVPLAAITFIGVVLLTRYVSVGSMASYTVLFVEVLILAKFDMLQIPRADYAEFIAIFAVMTLLAFWRHRANIVRLINGNENKIGGGKR